MEDYVCIAVLVGFALYGVYMIVSISPMGVWCYQHKKWEPKGLHRPFDNFTGLGDQEEIILKEIMR